jgi:tetratricopeptide (TPR) repeat protein
MKNIGLSAVILLLLTIISFAQTSVVSIREVTDVKRTDEFYNDLQSLIERYGFTNLTKDYKFNPNAKLESLDFMKTAVAGKDILKQLALGSGISENKLEAMWGKNCVTKENMSNMKESNISKWLGCIYGVGNIDAAAKDEVITRGRFAVYLNSAMDLAVQKLDTLTTSEPTPDQLKRASELYKQGVEFYDKNQFDQAIEKYNEYLKIRPNVADAFYNRGLAFYLKGIDLPKNTTESSKKNLNSAIADFSEAIKINPSSADAWIMRGRAYFWLRIDGSKYVESAITDFSQAIKLDANSADAYLGRGKAYRENYQPEKALADLNKAIQLNPNNADAYFERGNVYYSQNNFSLAKADFANADRINPQHPYAKNWLNAANQKLNPTQNSTIAVSQTKPTPTPTVTTAQTTTSTAQTWQKSFEEGKNYLQRSEADRAIASFQNALNQFPAVSDSDVIALILASQKAEILEQIAKAHIIKKDYKNAATSCINGQQFVYEKMINKLSAISSQNKLTAGELAEIAKSKLDMTVINYDLLIGQSNGAVELGERCLSYFPKSSMTTDEMMLTIGVGTLKLGTAEFVADMLYTTSSLRLSLSQLCQQKWTSLCGVNSRDNQTSKYSNKSLEDINKAIEYAPVLKKLYLQRAEVYRFLGKNDLALADQTKAGQLK